MTRQDKASQGVSSPREHNRKQQAEGSERWAAGREGSGPVMSHGDSVLGPIMPDVAWRRGEERRGERKGGGEEGR
ncbi:hypothetical protein E2C01_073309 [Portunus trituberculatus]|uniref:Uncharacterized protein n=1 Tax=Portunus trituberculatus TaxID=210409 RepID=A0A5B7I0D6_PORTR|nr:hypothetical protein [Portunus trituberculatus]